MRILCDAMLCGLLLVVDAIPNMPKLLSLLEYSRDGRSEAPLKRYSRQCLERVWKAERFSWWFTGLTHRITENELEQRMQLAELEYLTRSKAGMTTNAENYVGLSEGAQSQDAADGAVDCRGGQNQRRAC